MNEHSLPQKKTKLLPGHPLLRQFLLTFALTLCAVLLLTPLSNALRELSYSLSTDIETKGGFRDILCGILSAGCFYLTSFLSTVILFLGASFIARLMYRRRLGKAAGAGGILFASLCLSPALTFLAYVFLLLSSEGQGITLSDGAALLGQIGFALLRTAILFTVCFLCVALPRCPVRYLVCTLICAGVMTAFSYGIEVYDTLLPILRQGDMTAAELGSALLSLLLYLLHGAVGFAVMGYAGRYEV